MDLLSFEPHWLLLDEMQQMWTGRRYLYESPALLGAAFAISRELYDKVWGCDQHMRSWVSRTWAHTWRLFDTDRASAEQERAHLHARRTRHEFDYAERFGLPWPKPVGAAAEQAALLISPSPCPRPPAAPLRPSPAPSAPPPLGYSFLYFGGPGGVGY